MDPILNLSVLALALLLVMLVVPTWLLLPSAAHDWGNADAFRLELEIVPAPTPPPAIPKSVLPTNAPPAEARPTAAEFIPVPRWDFYLADGFRDGCECLNAALEPVAPAHDKLTLQLEAWIKDPLPDRERLDGPYTYWDAFFWVVGMRRSFALTASLESARPWLGQLLRAWNTQLPQLIVEKLTEAPPFPNPLDGNDGLWPPEACGAT